MRAIRVVDMTPRHPEHANIVFGTVAGLPAALCVLAVASDDTHEAQVALLPAWNDGSVTEPALPDSARDTLKDHVVAFSVAEDHGRATVSLASPVESEKTPLVAAVAAVVQFSYGWDESPLIAITIDGKQFRFSVKFVEGQSFVATPQAAA
jgi:hypothetical protein